MLKWKQMIDLTKLRNELTNVPDDYIILIETTAEKAFDLTLAAMKIFLVFLISVW